MSEAEFVRELALFVMKQKYKEMLDEHLNAMADVFDTRIFMAIDEAMEKTIKPTIVQEVEKQLKQDTPIHIQSEVAKYARKNVTLATNETVIKNVTEKVSKDIQDTLTNIMT